MATELGKAYVQIVPSARGIGKSIANEVVPSASKAGQSSGLAISGAIKKAIVVAGIGKALISTIKEGGKLQQSLGGIETLFKKNADTVKKYANDAYKTTGLSANAYMENVTGFSASLLQSMGGDTKKAAEIANMAMVDMADNSNKMGTSMESIQYAYQGFAKQNYTMLDNLKLGYGGTKTEMQRLLKDAQKLTGVKYDINNLSDVYQAIHAIQGKLDITGTTAKEASTTIMGSFSAMSASFSNVLGAMALGQGLEPALKGLVTTITTFVFKNLIPMLGNIIMQLPTLIYVFFQTALPEFLNMGSQLLNSIGNGVSAGLPDLLTKFSLLIANLQLWFQTQFPIFLQNGVNFIINLGNGMFSALPNLVITLGNIILSLLNTLAASIPTLMQKGYELISGLAKGFIKNLPAIEKSIGDILSRLLQLIIDKGPIIMMKGFELIGKLAKGLINNLPAILSAMGRILFRLLGVIIKNLPNIFQKGIQFIGTLAKGFLGNIGAVLSAIGRILSSVISGIVKFYYKVYSKGFEMIGNFAKGMIGNIGKVISAIGNILRSIVNKITGKVGEFANIGGNLIRGLWQGISNKTGWIINKIGGFTKSIVSRVKSFFGIHSPSRVFAEIGGYLDKGLAEGITDNVRPVEKAMDILGNAATDNLESELSYGIKSNNISDEFSQVNGEAVLIKLLKELLKKDSNIYLDGEKIGTILNPILAQTISEGSL